MILSVCKSKKKNICDDSFRHVSNEFNFDSRDMNKPDAPKNPYSVCCVVLSSSRSRDTISKGASPWKIPGGSLFRSAVPCPWEYWGRGGILPNMNLSLVNPIVRLNQSWLIPMAIPLGHSRGLWKAGRTVFNNSLLKGFSIRHRIHCGGTIMKSLKRTRWTIHSRVTKRVNE